MALPHLIVLLTILSITRVVYSNCICVPFWQCKADDSGFNEEGIDLLDIRIYDSGVPSEPSEHCTGDFDVCCRVQCGRRGGTDNTLQTRILGNTNANFAEFPWMLAILLSDTYKCGASLIHPEVALTAAHCVQDSGNYTVRAGEWNWDDNREPLHHQDRSVRKITTHPMYHAASLRNDIALLFLERPFELRENVGIACLPPQNMRFDGLQCVAAGWGRNSYKTQKFEAILKKIDLPVVPRGKCTKALQEVRLGPAFVLHKSFICAGGQPNKDTCKGDGGSPLMCPVDGEVDRLEQVGIVSWGLTCGLKNTPGVYVNVALFSEWIDRQMRNHNFDISIYKY